jgi:excisionase family DNA binding protein
MRTRIDENVRQTLRVSEAARIAGSGERAIRLGVASGTIPHIRFGRNIVIPKRAFQLWLDSCGRQMHREQQ